MDWYFTFELFREHLGWVFGVVTVCQTVSTAQPLSPFPYILPYLAVLVFGIPSSANWCSGNPFFACRKEAANEWWAGITFGIAAVLT